MRLPVIVLLLAFLSPGCTALEALFTPVPPRAPSPTSPAPEAPAPAPAEAPPVSLEPSPPLTIPVAPAPAPSKTSPVRKEAPPAPSPPVPLSPAPPAPPPVLAPQVGPEDQDRLQREAANTIKAIEQIVAQLDQKKLSATQQETSSTLQSFLVKAREALSAQDYLRATNLTEKAKILAEELVRDLR